MLCQCTLRGIVIMSALAGYPKAKDRRKFATVFIHPKISSTRFRIRWLTE